MIEVGAAPTAEVDQTLVSARRQQLVGLLALGALLGVTWAASLRGWMVQIVGQESTFTWVGTFLCLLLPGLVTGSMLGWAEFLRRTGQRGRARWLVFAPLALPAGFLSLPGALPYLIQTGKGASAVVMVLLAMVAGRALSGRGALPARVLYGLLGFALVPAAYFIPFRPELAFGTPLGTWAATNFATLFIVLAFACAIPQRR